MPEFYTLLGSEPTLELVGPTTTEEAVLLTAEAKPSGVVFLARIPQTIYAAEQFVGYADEVLEGRAVFMNHLDAMPETAGVSMVQDVNAANRLQDVLLVTVQSASGRLTANMEPIPFPAGLADVEAKIAAAADKLTQLERA